MLQSALERDLEARPYERPIREFGEIVAKDSDMLTQLDECPDQDSFIEKYLSMAKKHGKEFTRDQLLVAVQEQKMGSNWIIPKSVLMMVRDRF
ncbi:MULTISPECIES: hypothetical protein [unclassified Thioalkalivibrio]|uniref:hypothetical protein n=1 Tax=unclassified Thioalkalivibrio TaxID=2621013 RepID=UPI00036C6D37|nr:MULTISPECIES: hypothetical protein [unclassified Thioalkalivibrio]